MEIEFVKKLFMWLECRHMGLIAPLYLFKKYSKCKLQLYWTFIPPHWFIIASTRVKWKTWSLKWLGNVTMMSDAWLPLQYHSFGFIVNKKPKHVWTGGGTDAQIIEASEKNKFNNYVHTIYQNLLFWGQNVRVHTWELLWTHFFFSIWTLNVHQQFFHFIGRNNNENFNIPWPNFTKHQKKRMRNRLSFRAPSSLFRWRNPKSKQSSKWLFPTPNRVFHSSLGSGKFEFSIFVVASQRLGDFMFFTCCFGVTTQNSLGPFGCS